VSNVAAQIRAKLSALVDNETEAERWIRKHFDAADGEGFPTDAYEAEVAAGRSARAAILALVDEHEEKHQRLGEPYDDHSNDGRPLCRGWRYRPHQDCLCRHIRTIAARLGIEAEDAD
jgi:hypothetical protein